MVEHDNSCFSRNALIPKKVSRFALYVAFAGVNGEPSNPYIYI